MENTTDNTKNQQQDGIASFFGDKKILAVTAIMVTLVLMLVSALLYSDEQGRVTLALGLQQTTYTKPYPLKPTATQTNQIYRQLKRNGVHSVRSIEFGETFSVDNVPSGYIFVVTTRLGKEYFVYIHFSLTVYRVSQAV